MMHAPRLEPYDRARHYALIASWWKAAGNDCLPVDVLPPTGAIALIEDEPAAACFVYLMDGTRAAYVAWPVAAPDLTPRMRYAALEFAIAGAVDIARLKRCTMIWSSTTHDGMARLFEKTGLIRTTPHHNFFMILDGNVSHDMLIGEGFEQRKD